MGLNIENPEAVALAEEIARLKGVSETEAIRLALEKLRDELVSQREERAKRIREAVRRFQEKIENLPDSGFSEDDLYDEHGLPK